MIKGIYKTAASMVPRVKTQEVIANNLANSETPGFKRDSIFLRMVQDQKQTRLATTPLWEVKMTEGLYTDYSEGSLDKTGRSLDVAIDGDGFFVIQTLQGEAYTRSGSFSLSPTGELVTSDGMPVLSDAGPVVVPGGEISIDDTGQIIVDGEPLATLRVVDFPKPYELTKLSGTVFTAPTGVVPVTLTAVTVRQGYLERSNVDALREMVDMIGSYRAFELGQKMIRIQDESLDKAVNDLPRT